MFLTLLVFYVAINSDTYFGPTNVWRKIICTTGFAVGVSEANEVLIFMFFAEMSIQISSHQSLTDEPLRKSMKSFFNTNNFFFKLLWTRTVYKNVQVLVVGMQYEYVFTTLEISCRSL